MDVALHGPPSSTPAGLAGDLEWFSGASQTQRRAPRGFLLAHFFNYQTHHRGQAHALITAAGEKMGDTDLMLIVSPLQCP